METPKAPQLTGNKMGDARLCIRAYKSAVRHFYGLEKAPPVDKKAVFRMQTVAARLRSIGFKNVYGLAGFQVKEFRRFAAKREAELVAKYQQRGKTTPKKHLLEVRRVARIDQIFYSSVADKIYGRRWVGIESVTNPHYVVTEASQELEIIRNDLLNQLTSMQADDVEAAKIVQETLPQRAVDQMYQQALEEKLNREAVLSYRMAEGLWIW